MTGGKAINGRMDVASVQDALLSEADFFGLLDEVLGFVGRAPLAPGGPERSIISVHPEDRVLQILAGAGSGKTEMLVWRVLYQLFVAGTPSSRVMVTTFTNKAATELSVRVVERSDALLEQARKRGLEPADPHVHDLRIGTLHSLCDGLLAEFDDAYMAAGTQVIDETETRVRMARTHRWTLGFTGQQPGRTVDRLLGSEELVALFRPPWNEGRWPGNTFQRISFLLALLGQHTETWLPRCGPSGQLNGVEAVAGPDGLTDDLITLQERWEDYLDQQDILDFATIQRRFQQRQGSVVTHLDHVFVDEFQDTNPIQFAIHLAWLSRPETKLTVVGDDDQALYRFRGSDIACFIGLEDACRKSGIAFRQEKLEQNWRSSSQIVAFTGAFRRETVLAQVSMPKAVRAPRGAPVGKPPRLLQGTWAALCNHVADELSALGAGRPPDGNRVPPSVAVLLFSTSEKEWRRGAAPGLDMRRALEARGLRVYNPRNKTAGRPGSPVHSLAALLSYLIDPVTIAPAGAGGRPVMVWASCGDAAKSAFAVTAPPAFPVAAAHATIQKEFRGSTAGIQAPGPAVAELLRYLDQIRADLADATEDYLAGRGRQPRLTLSGLVARLLTFPLFRDVGFTPALFREALFTRLLEANVAPTRRSRRALDQALAPTRDSDSKIVWPDEIWNFLNIFGPLLKETDLDDVEDDAFSENAVALLTFHQAKGLEFDHVYVGMTGREPNVHAVLQTMLFSGKAVPYEVDQNGQPACRDPEVARLALADREREVYVAITRAKERLTLLHDPADTRPMTALNPGIAALFADRPAHRVAGHPGLVERTWQS
jgi:DNA helicase-2/ATP-dependent DNA helicase PcrA